MDRFEKSLAKLPAPPGQIIEAAKLAYNFALLSAEARTRHKMELLIDEIATQFQLETTPARELTEFAIAEAEGWIHSVRRS